MSYTAKLGDIAERYHEKTGTKYIYTLRLQHNSGIGDVYIIEKTLAEDGRAIEEVLALDATEMGKLIELVQSE